MDPANKHNPDIEPEIRPKLGVINGDGESTSERGNLSEASAQGSELDKDEKKFGLIQGGGESTDDRGDLSAIRDQEQQGLYVTGDGQKKIVRGKAIAKKYGGVFGLISILGLGGGLIASFFGPATMLINLMENFTSVNDSSTTAMERRFLKVLNNMTEPTDPVCANSKKLKCKMGKISNNALNKLERKGIVANFDSDANNTGKRTGYPSKNPKSYTIDMGGGTTKTVNAKDLTGFLTKNPKVASKVLGRGGAFNLKYKAWSGKYIANKFYKTFNLKREGGLADGNNQATSSTERLRAIREKLALSSPSLNTLDSSEGGVRSKITDKVGSQLEMSKKGGVAYTTAVAGCITVKAPGYIAAGVAGAQLLQILPIYMDLVASPGSKAKAAGVGSGFSGEDMDSIGSLLTQKTKRESDGKMTSALDSPYLLAAMGANKGKPAVSKDFSPGYGILQNPLVKTAESADKDTEKQCNAVMSPAAMYTAMAVDSTATVLLSATVVGGIIKVLASWAITELASKAVEKLVATAADKAIKEIAESDKIPTAKGEELGDVLGISAMAFYASGGMSRSLPVLKQSQVTAYENIRQENELFNRAMDVASLSPFDTSSKYTFLGSIQNNLSMAMIANGSSGYTLGSMLSSIAGLSSLALNPTAGAATGLNSNYCDYAADFSLTTEKEADTPAITASGLPCTGITTDQAAMSTDQAVNHMINEEWVDDTIDISDDADLDALISSGVIKEGTPLSDFIETCSNPASGDHIFNAASCTTTSSSKGTNGAGAFGGNGCVGEGESQSCAGESTDFDPPKGIKDGRSLAAQTPFLLDYQILQTINGEDEEPETASAAAATGAATFTVGTYNMCQELNHPTCPNQPTKVQKIVSVIEGTAGLNSAPMDIVGAQELSIPTQEAVLSSLSGYESYPARVPANNGKAIFWNTSTFQKASGSGSEGLLTGVHGNGSSNSVDNNSFPWVHLNSTSGQSVYVMSVHSPNDGFGSPADRFENAQKIKQWAQQKSDDGSLIVLTGDFNNGQKQDGDNPGAYCYLTSEGFMQHAKDAADSKPTDQACPSNAVPIDQIYASTNVAGMTATGWRHVSGADSAANGTDHSPAYVTYTTTTTGANYGSDEVKMPLPANMWNLYNADFLDPHTADSGTWTSGVRSLAVDIGSPPDGTAVYAMVGGTVSQSDLGGHGLAIKSEIQGGTLEIAYAHGPRTNANTTYAAGEQIMTVGALGNVTGGHLHIDMAFNGQGVCPQLVFAALGAGQTVNFAALAQQSRAPC
ncbi:MAG: peptidoglycan DD-metalloendopeptidase family protein [Patescibacteria group bacterium]